jgi:biotin carboxyl carrier protein
MRRKFRVTVNGKEYVVEIEEIGEGAQVPVAPSPVPAPAPAVPAAPPPSPKEKGGEGGDGVVTAPMPGKVLSVRVRQGERVQSGHVLLILEAMKMENEIVAPVGGVVEEIRVSEGASVERGDVLVVIKPD